MLSYSRVVIAFFVAWLAADPQYAAWNLVLVALACLTDMLDGALARLLGEEDGLGCMIDPVADAFFLLLVWVSLTVHAYIPWWLFYAVLTRYVILQCMHSHLYFLGYLRLKALWSGKCSACSCVLLVFLVFVHQLLPSRVPDDALVWGYYAVLVLVLVSFLQYTLRYLLLCHRVYTSHGDGGKI